MKSKLIKGFGASLCVLATASNMTLASANPVAQYEITVTNITRGQQLTPILAAAHTSQVAFFQLGNPASSELEILAESGAVGPLQTVLSSTDAVGGSVAGDSLTNPGDTVTLQLEASPKFNYVSLAAMLIPTNDAFFAVNRMPLPQAVGGVRTYTAVAYDSGTEVNDELCASIPGPNFPECGGPGGGGEPTGGEEGFVHVHAGIHGIGDFMPYVRDWRNPVVTVTVRRVR